MSKEFQKELIRVLYDISLNLKIHNTFTEVKKPIGYHEAIKKINDITKTMDSELTNFMIKLDKEEIDKRKHKVDSPKRFKDKAGIR